MNKDQKGARKVKYSDYRSGGVVKMAFSDSFFPIIAAILLRIIQPN